MSAQESARRCERGRRLAEQFPTLIAGDGSDSLDTEACQNERMSAGVAVGDVNSDGRPDLYVSRVDGPGRLFVSTAPLRYEDRTVESGLDGIHEASSGAVFADLDNDGDEDLVVTPMFAPGAWLFLNDGAGRFVERGVERGLRRRGDALDMGMSVAVGDYDRDGYVDVFTTEWRSPYLAPSAPYHATLFHNRGARAPGHFEDVTKAAGVQLARTANPAWSFGAQFVDLDADGWQDLAVTSDFGTSRVFWNDRDGTFTDGTQAAKVGTDENGMGSTIADVDGDGLPEWFVTGIFSTTDVCEQPGCGFGRSGNRLYHNRGHRRFVDTTDTAGVRDADWAWGTAFVDARNTGRLDLVAVSGFEFSLFEELARFSGTPVRFWNGDGEGGFSSVANAAGLSVKDGKGVAVFDADGDGRLDLVVAVPGSAVRLFHNETPDPGHWIRVEVSGVRTNRDGLGAIVSVTPEAGGRTIRREVGSVTGFLGGSDPQVQVGVGDATTINEVRVDFPASGRTVIRRDVTVDQRLRIHEPRR